MHLTLSSVYENELLTAAGRLLSDMTALARGDYADLPLVIFGPFEAPLYRVAGKYRMRMVVKCRLNKQSRAYFSRILTEFSARVGRRIALSLDANPTRG